MFKVWRSRLWVVQPKGPHHGGVTPHTKSLAQVVAYAQVEPICILLTGAHARCSRQNVDVGGRLERPLPEYAGGRGLLCARAVARGAISRRRPWHHSLSLRSAATLAPHGARCFPVAGFFLRRGIGPLHSHLGGAGRNFGGGSIGRTDRQG